MMKPILFALMLSLLFIDELPAQNVPSSWSIDLYGGGTIGHFTHTAAITPHGAINARYSLNPVFSVYGTAGSGQFQSPANTTTGNFDNLYFTYGAGVRSNVLRMLAGPAPITEHIGIYTQTGLNVIYNDVVVNNTTPSEHASQDYTGNALLVRLGGGLSIRLSRRLDFFTQAVFNISNSDLLDGHERAPGSSVSNSQIFGGKDAYLNTSAGFSIKFGSSSVSHADWYDRDHRVDPLAQALEETLQRIEAEMDLTNTTMDSMHERIRVFERSLDDLNHVVNTVHSDQMMEYHSQIESLQTRLQLLQSEFEELSTRVETRTVATGEKKYFVVAGVFRSISRAETLLREIKSQGFENAEIIRDRSRSYYLVNYIGYASRVDAVAKLDQIRTDVNPESWVYIR